MNLLVPIVAAVGSLSALAATQVSPSYSAHEWGTFTSVQGADGVQMIWNPQSAAELPKFVYSDPTAFSFKSVVLTRQRLETPVIYFHAQAPLTVDVDVIFPKGHLTEWYPSTPDSTPMKMRLSWPKVAIIPQSSPEAAALGSKLPSGQPGSHYYAARDAEADFIQMPQKNGAAQVEKFIFYRGVGDFTAPLKVTIPNPSEAALRLENTGTEALRNLVAVRVEEGSMTITALGDLQAKASTAAAVGSPVPIEEGRKQLNVIMREAVARAGLTPSEAAAMVKTWDDSWFTERGVRVLYVLPRPWSDTVLPLTLNPAPSQLERVFVGRAEVITPAMEKALAAEIDHGISGDEAARSQATKNIRALGLGRFLMPTLERVSAQRSQNDPLKQKGWEFVQAINAPAPKTPQQ